MFWSSPRTHYEFIEDTEKESLDVGRNSNDFSPDKIRSQSRSSRWRTLLTIGGWILSGILAIIIFLQTHHQQIPSDFAAFKATSSYTPLLISVPTSLQTLKTNGSFRFPSPYRGEPSRSVDQAWDRISMLRPLDLPLTDSEFLAIGSSVSTAARNAPEHGGGFFLQPEFSHQLHCVNLLRKASYFKYDYYKPRDPDFTDNIELFKVHVDHCTEMLRQFVMCHADVGIVTAHWIDQRRAAWPDFNTRKVCRDFEGIFESVRKLQLPVGTPMRPSRPEGASVLPAPP